MTRAQVVWTVVGSALALMATSSSAAWIVSRTIAESEARLRIEIQNVNDSVNQRFDAVNQRFDVLNDSVNQRFDALNDSVNQRFDAMNDSVNQRFDALNDSVNQRIHSVNQRLDAALLDDGR